MKGYTSFQTLTKIYNELGWTVRLLVGVQAKFEEKSKTRIDLGDIERVLRTAQAEVGRIIRLQTSNEPKSLNHRQAEDSALKAQLAKARDAVASALEDVEDGHSHK